ncbi:FMN-dependent alpha-hydroxy acid dehydrogenase [Lipomyces arxii]|uniref:FMN-dependent alpha-hydroxy acid dehydrogenase n=1 Tax=Lipomyces arxii TaxID=56418 RepID=UPI0034CD208B
MEHVSNASRGSWSEYQREIYGRLSRPEFSTNVVKWESDAKLRVPLINFNYVYGSANQRRTYDANIAAFSKYKLIPRMLRGATKRDLSVELFGKKYPSPILIAPVGVQSLMHKDAELATARAAAKLNIPFILSTASSTNLESVAEAHKHASRTEPDNSGLTSPDRWYQLYWPEDDTLTVSLLRRAEAAGFSTLVVTLDTFVMGFRPDDLDEAFLPFVWGEGCAIGFSDPVFMDRYSKQLASAQQPGIFESLLLLLRRCNGSIFLFFALLRWHKQIFKSLAWLSEVFNGTHKSWEDLKFLREHWKGPIVLKGIQSVEDAQMANKYGMDGIVVSNHGGRQVDGAIGSLDALVNITTDPVIQSSNLTILFDSGIRTGADILKALALGASAVLIGRPFMYGLALGGERGVDHVLRVLLADADITMGNIGCKSIAELDRNVLQE